MKKIFLIILLAICTTPIFSQEIGPGELRKTNAIVPRDANQTPGSALYVYDKSDSTFKAYTPNIYHYETTIADGNTNSSVLDFGILRPSYIEVAAGADGTELSFNVYSEKLAAWIPFRKPDKSEIKITVDASAARYYLEPYIWNGVDRVQVVAATQTGELKIYFGTRIY